MVQKLKVQSQPRTRHQVCMRELRLCALMCLSQQPVSSQRAPKAPSYCDWKRQRKLGRVVPTRYTSHVVAGRDPGAEGQPEGFQRCFGRSCGLHTHKQRPWEGKARAVVHAKVTGNGLVSGCVVLELRTRWICCCFGRLGDRVWDRREALGGSRGSAADNASKSHGPDDNGTPGSQEIGRDNIHKLLLEVQVTRSLSCPPCCTIERGFMGGNYGLACCPCPCLLCASVPLHCKTRALNFHIPGIAH